MTLTLKIANAIADGVLEEGRRQAFQPLTVAVLDPGGHVILLKRDDGASSLRPKIAIAKASGCLALGFGGRELAARAEKMPAFFAAANALAPDGILPVPGGVLLRDEHGALVGAVGVTGDTSLNDEKCALTAIEAFGLRHETGE